MTQGAGAWPHATSPIRVGRLLLRNRIFVPAHTTNFGADHLPTQRHLDYHVARARGGVAAIIFESLRVQPNCVGRPQAVAGFDRRSIAPLARIGAAVRAEGARLLGQIIHLGRQVDGDYERTASWGPSAIPWSATAAMPHAMNEDDLQAVIDAHVATALNLVEADLDGIEVQLGHGHLLQQFLSPSSNRRDDDWGGSLANRLRLPIAVAAAVRRAVGPSFCLGIRISADEFIDGGLTLAEMCEATPRIAAAVALDFVNVSHSAYQGNSSLATQMADMAFAPTAFRHLPGAIRSALRAAGHSLPVMSVCRYQSLDDAEAAIAAGDADLIGMARAHIAEPALVAKSLAGQAATIRPCIACNQGCAGMLEKNIAIRCVANPRAGIEGDCPEPEDDPAAVARDIVVVGGGPAGAQAAWVAAARGHRVRLLERGRRLGGQLAQLERVPSRHDWLRLLDYQARQLARHRVEVVLGVDVAAAALAGGVDGPRPDRVILATGSRPAPAQLPGAGPVLDLAAVIAREPSAPRRIAFVDRTGEWSSLATIEHLARSGHRVTVFSPVAAFAWRTTIYSTLATTRRLREHGVRIATLRRPVHWDGRTLTVEDVSCGEQHALDGFDDVVLAQYGLADDALHRPLLAAGIAVTAVGDCLAPRTAMEAIYEGHRAGLAA
ncbi:MAG: NAD(P)-binding protein [Lautropia sp.]